MEAAQCQRESVRCRLNLVRRWQASAPRQQYMGEDERCGFHHRRPGGAGSQAAVAEEAAAVGRRHSRDGSPVAFPSVAHGVRRAACPSRGECLSRHRHLSDPGRRARATVASVPLPEVTVTPRAEPSMWLRPPRGLSCVVITSVTRDDLADGGAAHHSHYPRGASRCRVPRWSSHLISPVRPRR